jgi:hypothetical protein
MTWVEIAWGLFVAAFSAGLSWAVARRTMRTQVASDAHVASVNALLPALVHLRALIHESAVKQHEPREVAAAVTAFEEVCMQHELALPRSVSSVRRNVRSAVGNYFGGASLAVIDAELADYPLSEFDPYWQDISQSYVEYVMAQLQLSLVSPRAERMRYFHEWRKDEDWLRR